MPVNWASANRELLSRRNYIRQNQKSPRTSIRVRMSEIKTREDEWGDKFNLIFIGEESTEDDFYVIPYSFLRDLFAESAKVGYEESWSVTISDNCVRVGTNERPFDTAKFKGRKIDLHDLVTLEDQTTTPLTHQHDLRAKTGVPSDSSHGQGYLAEYRERIAIENCAVQAALRHYQAEGFDCELIGKPYDLRCRRGDEERHVEVKGTKGEGQTVLLSKNEVEHARDSSIHADLFIWRRIQTTASAGAITAVGGELFRHIRGWVPEESRLTPTEYEYHVPPQ